MTPQKGGDPSGAILFAGMIFIEKLNNNEILLLILLKMQNGLIQIIRMVKYIHHKRVNNNRTFASKSSMSKFKCILSYEDANVCKDIVRFVTVNFSIRLVFHCFAF